jgi:tryptophan-rich sensory protein
MLLLLLLLPAADKGGRALPLTLYLTQLGLNLAWTPLFFQQHWADAALVDSAGEYV